MKAVLALLAASLVLAACGERPFATSPPTLPPGDPREVVAVCYAGTSTTREEIARVAQKECEYPESTVSFLSEEKVFNGCPIFQKLRATYVCSRPTPGIYSPGSVDTLRR